MRTLRPSLVLAGVFLLGLTQSNTDALHGLSYGSIVLLQVIEFIEY